VNRAWIYLGLAAALAIVGRAIGPSDLHDNDQPKTVAYTVDMVENGRWFLPVDMLGNPTTKPPLFNWIGTPFYAAFGPGAFVLTLPSVIAALVVVGLTVGMGRHLAKHDPASRPVAADRVMPCLELGVVAGVIWLASSIGIKHVYLARPDVVLAAALTGAWAAATVCLQSPAASRKAQVALWLCVALAALAKGPLAVLAIIYIVLGAKLLTGRMNSVHRTGWWWGLPVSLLIAGLWAYLAYLADPAGFRAGMLNDTIEHRSTAGGFGAILLNILTDLWRMPAQFFARFLPWSAFVILALIHIPPRRWFASAYGPAILWVLIVVGFFMLSPRQRPDYLLPAYGPAAILAAYWLVVVAAKYRITARKVAVVGLLIIIGFNGYYWYFNDAARTGWGDNTVRFADAIRRLTADDPIVFKQTGYNPLQSLVGVNHAQPTDPRWMVQPLLYAGDRVPMLISEPIPGVGQGAGAMGLYRLDPSPD